MSEELMVRHCSPTLAGMKAGNLFSCHYENFNEMKGKIIEWNRMLSGKGLRVVPLRYRDGRGLIYVYRSSHLFQDLQQEEAKRLLAERGYNCETPERCILHLIRRLSESEEFPHEIGLFLSYPPEDVCGFIENRDGCKCTGCWKVYGDADAAQKTFAKYRKCTEAYCAQLARGTSIERLAVAG